ncbi:predicted protein [Histoplasma capsulatum var. duboisii H88]|uniref:Predicted protein n=2 Tax=Ajellomyces capsulatus TaxID=5037 RepID=F0UP34_AJEC8|nr:predicted protein [Histoplasma capsulatum H143]EGC46893.1 predicted protein [Histoplasma capsulatum var. duboisii H88]
MLAAHFGPQISEVCCPSPRLANFPHMLSCIPSRVPTTGASQGNIFKTEIDGYILGARLGNGGLSCLILLISTLVNKLGPNDIISAFPPTDYFAPNPATMASLSSRL